ncbi:MAG: hypothetical protein AB1523_04165 [Bacillota bacterium]
MQNPPAFVCNAGFLFTEGFFKKEVFSKPAGAWRCPELTPMLRADSTAARFGPDWRRCKGGMIMVSFSRYLFVGTIFALLRNFRVPLVSRRKSGYPKQCRVLLPALRKSFA